MNAINRSSTQNYMAIDFSPVKGNNFYRMKMTDKNGAITYSSIEKVSIDNQNPYITIYPNPAQNKLLHVRFSNLPQGKFNFIIYNSSGQQVFKKIIEHTGNSSIQTLVLPFTIKPGAYVVKIFNETNNFTSIVVME